MCSIHGDNSPVDFDATNKLADNTAQSSLVEAQTHRVAQQQAGPTTDRHRRPPQNVDKHLRGFQAGPLQNLLHQHSNRPQHLPMLNRLQAAISPKGPGSNDRTRNERLLNTLTSLPIAFVGLHTIRHRETAAGVHFGARARLASMGLVTLLPFQPTAVTAINASIAQVEFAKCSQRCPALRSAHRRQAASLVAGLACFGLEDAAMKHNMGFVHAMWHCLACYVVSSANFLIKHKECEMQDSSETYTSDVAHN